MTTKRRRTKVLGALLVALGAFLVATGILARAYAYDRLAVMPVDAVADVVATTAPDRPATYFDIGRLEEVTGPLVNRTRIRGDVAAGEQASRESDQRAVVWVAHACTNPADAPNYLTDKYPLAASVDVTAFGAHSSEVVPWSGSSHASGGEIDDSPTMSGYVYKLPFNVQKQDYSYWDADLEKPVTLTYEGETTVKGLCVFTFTEVVEPTKIGTVDVPGSLVGSTEPTVTGDRIVASRTTMTVEPESGVAITTTSSPQSYVNVDGKRALTLIDGTLSIDDDTVAKTVKDYKPTAFVLHFLRVWVLWVGCVGGGLALMAGFLLLSSQPRVASRAAT